MEDTTQLKSDFELNPNLWISWYTRDDVNFVYIPVHRCATNWMIDLLTHNGFYEILPSERDAFHNKERLVIIREPTERVLSGMFVPSEEIDLSVLDSNIDKLEFERKLSNDVHTSNQTKYLSKNDNGKYIYFKFGSDLPDKIYDYMNSQGVVLESGPMNWTTTAVGAESRERREKVFSDPKLLNMFREFLKEDYELYNSVEFYGTN